MQDPSLQKGDKCKQARLNVLLVCPSSVSFQRFDARAMCCRLENTQMPTQRSLVGRWADSVLMRDRSKVSCYGTALCCQDDGHLEVNGPEAAHLSLSTIKIVYLQQAQ